MTWTKASTWDSSAWSGASGTQIGFAGDVPETLGQGFITDPVHGTPVDPNAPQVQAREGDMGSVEVPVSIQDEESTFQYDGGYGWVLDDIPFDSHDTPPGVDADTLPFTGHNMRPGTGIDHEFDVYQDSAPIGHGRNFYGQSFITNFGQYWRFKPSVAPNNTRAFPAEAREDTGHGGELQSHDAVIGTGHEEGWPEPFAVQDIDAERPIVIPDEKIHMNRMPESDRPVYQQLAVPARNITPGESQWLPNQYSNPPIHNITPLPAMARTPENPWDSNTVDYSTDDTWIDPLAGVMY
jgi:hypothetical protein